MLGELPPVVALPSNPAAVLAPVPLFLRCRGLYSARTASHGSECVSRKHVVSGQAVGAPVVPSRADTTQPQSSRVVSDEVALPSATPRNNNQGNKSTGSDISSSSKIGEAAAALNGHNLAALTENDVDVLLEVLESRYDKYSAVKKRTTEQYLARIENEVDRFLLIYYGGSSSRFSGGVASFIRSKLMPQFPSQQRDTGGKGHCRNGTGETPGNSVNGTNISSSNQSGGLPTLQESSYSANVIPFNYLDVRPANMQSIAGNLVVLRHCLEECSSPGSAVRQSLVDPIVRGVWDQSLTPLENSAKELLKVAQQNVRPPLEYLLQQQQCNAERKREWRARYDRVVKALQDDLNYLRTIYEMDRERVSVPAQARRDVTVGLSDYVPISGLTLSRLHRLENEHRTVWDFWRTRRGNF
ncbi:hypothetical protein DQ04_04581000 [Trypanosoma grayi]|uniref:hypothetical protein n=1 Tax=Trypanosoma grayi TaxID=71804 RepID=UPI0004F48FC9|nr:hypothetical protein DQ04_04581000 [Trypanosoma grayi]KEG09818.1 hypothetical protein DQ04_04581000 [Trypanosoma grayi]